MSGDFHVIKCIVCGKRKQYGRLLQFYKFPYDMERCKTWVRAIGMRELLFMPIQKLREQFVCAIHFGFANIPPNHLNKLALPCLTPYPTLSDEDIKDFPKNRNMAETGPIKSYDGHGKERGNQATTLSESDPVIDYERPLMENLGTLVHNEKHFVKKPAGILNSIAVPLMTYSSSLEKGTVFAAADPGNTYNLPFVPFIEPSSQNEYKASKRYTNVRAITDQKNSDMNISPTPKLVSTVKGFIKTTEPMHKNTLVGKVKPNVKPVENIPKTGKAQTQQNYNISFGLNTLITGHPRKANKDKKVNILEGPPTFKAPEQRYKNIKQYSNNRLTIKKNIPLIHNKIISAKGTAVSLPQTGLMPIKADHVISNQYIKINKALNSSHSSAYVSFEPASSIVYNEADTTSDSLDTNDSATINSTGQLSRKPETSCDLSFVPYSQYVTTITPESPNAHTASGTLDYGLPLMNCVGTVFQGNIQTTIKTEAVEEPEVIDVPLMKCLKTLQNTKD